MKPVNRFILIRVMNMIHTCFVAGRILTALLPCTTGLQAASTIQFTATSYNVAEDAGTVSLTVQRSDDTNTVVRVDYASTNGTATAGLKYTAVSGTLAFAAGVTNQAIVVPILNEAFVEGTQTFQVISWAIRPVQAFLAL